MTVEVARGAGSLLAPGQWGEDAERSPVAQAAVRVDGLVLAANAALAALLGLPDAAGLPGRSLRELLPDPRERGETLGQLADLAAGRTAVTTAERCLRVADGPEVDVLLALSALPGAGPRAAGDGPGLPDVVLLAAYATGERRRAQGEQADRHEFVQGVLDTVDVGIAACDAQGRLTLFNHATRRFHGLAPDASVPPQEWATRFDLFEADGTTPLPAERVPLLRALLDGEVHGAEMVIAPRGLPARLVRCDGRALRDPSGAVVGAVVAMSDITASRAAERELRAAHAALTTKERALARASELFRNAFDHGPMAMCRLDAAGVVKQANPALRRLLAVSTPRLIGRPLTGLVAPGDRERLAVALAAARSTALSVEPVEVRAERSDGSRLWVEVSTTLGVDEAGEAFVLVQLADVDARKTREEHLERLAAHDSLTGLANRSALTAQLTDRLAPGAEERPLTLLFLDLDGFKGVNDTLGHAAGDAVLVEVARRLREVVRPTDTVARLGGDEFVVACWDLDGSTSDRGTQALVGRLRAALEVPVDLPEGPYAVSASIGVAHAVPGEQPAAVLARADASMYAGKAQRRASRQPGDPSRSARSPGSLPQPRLTDLVDTAVEEGRLHVVYQPVVELTTGVAVGAEALVRMTDRRGGLVMPDAFIPVAEATGSIAEIGAWVLATACAQAVVWRRGLPAGTEFSMAVNLSPRQLDDERLLQRLDAALEASGLPPESLVLELTERLLTTDTAHVRTVLAQVRDRGVHLAADDFGTGYSSVRYLADLPLDIIKLDRSWTSRLGHDGAAGRLATGVARLAEATGLLTIAEGVEDERERAAALAHGCRLAQGYLFARPLSVDELSLRLLPGGPVRLPRPRAAG